MGAEEGGLKCWGGVRGGEVHMSSAWDLRGRWRWSWVLGCGHESACPAHLGGGGERVRCLGFGGDGVVPDLGSGPWTSRTSGVCVCVCTGQMPGIWWG